MHSKELTEINQRGTFSDTKRLDRQCGKKTSIILALALSSILTFSMQTVRGQSEIQGVILDDSDKAVRNATVILINAFDSSDVLRTVANENGLYFFNNVPIGDYLVKVSAIGFEQAITSVYSIVTGQDLINAGITRMRVMNRKRARCEW